MKLHFPKGRMRKYEPGKNACAHCAVTHTHHLCRPRLDGTLCSCSCPTATKLRQDFEERSRFEVITIEDWARETHPRFKVRFS